MILYVEKSKDAKDTRDNSKDNKLISEFICIVIGYKITIHQFLAILYTNKEYSEREIKETIPFTNAAKRIKYLGVNLKR